MAKPLGEKTRVIRAAITANPGMDNKPLAEKLNDSPDRLDDKFTFTAQDIASQKQAMKKPGAVKAEPSAPAAASASTPAAPKSAASKPAPKKRGRPKGSATAPKKAAPVTWAPAAAPKAQRGPVELIDRLFELADDVGGLGALKRLVDRISTIERA